MIQDAIINELQYIPEAKLFELYDFIHYFRLGLNSEKKAVEDEFKIDPQACLAAFEKIKRGDRTGLTEITDVKEYIANLRHEIS